MKLKKIIASVAAASVLASVAVSATSASAALTWTPPTNGYTAFMLICSTEFSSWVTMHPNGAIDGDKDEDGRYAGGFGQDALVTGDGTYTVAVEAPADGDVVGGSQYVTGKIIKNADGYYLAENTGCPDLNPDDGFLAELYAPTVFCVDICGLIDGTEKYDSATKTHVPNDETPPEVDGMNCKAGPYKASQITATVDSIKFDGVEAKFDPSKIVTGNVENNNYRYRIEISNAYGSTANDCALIDPPVDEIEARKVEVTFTLSGLDSASPETSANTSADTTANNSGDNGVQPSTTAAAADNGTATTTPSTSAGADTGATAGLALGGIALAGVAIVLAKKRK